MLRMRIMKRRMTDPSHRYVQGVCAAVFLLILTACSSRLGIHSKTGASASFAGIVYAQTSPDSESRMLNEYERAVIEATKKAIPAVVSIQTYGTRIYEIRDPFLRMFYGDRVGQRVSGMGSGVIIDPDGIIITNDHVIGLAQGGSVVIQVTLPDGRTFDARLMKTFPGQDIAIIKVDGKNLPTIEFASSANVVQGQTAIAIGNPFGKVLTSGFSGGESTVTRGIISAMKRSLTIESEGVERYYRNMLQTDASINQGNSGGALIDLDGKLIGMNTAIYTAGGPGSIGIGFAIPSDRIKLVCERVMKYGDIGTPYDGITVEDMSDDMREALGLKSQVGIIIKEVTPGSPGDQGGFRRGDVITAVNGLFINNIRDAGSMFMGAIPGEVYTLTVFRKGIYKNMELVLAAKK